jgi:hypothetical protein
MKRTQIGPLPLLAGLQLQPAEGRPQGLLRALNVEARDGLLQTRRGSAPIAAFWDSNVGLRAQASPAGWTGQTVTYLGFDAVDIKPDSIMMPIVVAGAAEPTVVDVTTTYEFFAEDGGAGSWQPINVVNVGEQTRGVPLVGPGTDTFYHLLLSFVTPSGWKNAQPAGTPLALCWLRITRSVAWGTNVGIGGGLKPQISAIGARGMVAAPSTRNGCGPFVVIPYYFDADTAVWSVIDISQAPRQGRFHNTHDDFIDQSVPKIAAPLFDGRDPAYVYVPASDVLLLSLGTRYVVVDCGKGAQDVGACRDMELVFDPEGQYGDISCEAALPPGARVLCVFGGRVFAGGFIASKMELRWSAPREFWETWPSSNVAFLGGGASGELVAGVPVDETLFLFTTSGIWRAALGDPPAGVESALFTDLVEETPCVAGSSVVATASGIVFLSSDGVRVFDGKRSRLISAGIIDLFRPNSEHPLACLRKADARAVWHPLENQYRLSYPSPGAQHNDVVVVVDLDDKTAWLWGADQLSATDSFGLNLSAGAQRARGLRIAGWAWDARSQSIVIVDPEGCIGRMDTGAADFTDGIRWYAETQNLRIARNERAIVHEVDLSVVREHFRPFAVSVIPDGDRARADMRTVAVDPDGLDTTSAIGAASLAGNMTPLQLDGSVAPVHARFRKVARNHRIRIEGVAPNYDPIKLLAVNASISAQDEDR